MSRKRRAKTGYGRWRGWSGVAATLVATLMASATAGAQTCPYCYANAAAQTPGMLQALKTGVLVMMLPSLAMFIVIFAVVYRRREAFNSAGDWEAGATER